MLEPQGNLLLVVQVGWDPIQAWMGLMPPDRAPDGTNQTQQTIQGKEQRDGENE